MAKIAQLHDNIDKTRYVVLRRDNIIGRAPDSNVLVANKTVSSHHARIASAPGTNSYYIEDVSARGTYVNFRRIKGRYPLKEGDRICVLMFRNVHPGEIARMTPDELKTYCDDPRVEGVKPAADFTFGYIEAKEPPPDAAAQPVEEQPKGLLAKLKGLFGKK